MMKLGKLGAAILSVIPAHPALLTTAAVVPLAVAGCSSSNFDEARLNIHANQRAMYHIKLANVYDDIVTAFAKEIDKHDVSPEAKARLFEWNKKLKDSRDKLLKSFSTNNTDDIIPIIKKIGTGRATEEQEKAHYNYRVTAVRAYFEGIGGPEIFNKPKLDELHRSFNNRFDEIRDEDYKSESSLKGDLAYWDRNQHNSIPWGYRNPPGSEYGQYGWTDKRYLEFGEK